MTTTNPLDWLRPDLIVGSVVYAFIGVVVLWVSFIVIDKLTPFALWDELVRKQNIALAIVVGAMFIALGLIVAAAIHA